MLEDWSGFWLFIFPRGPFLWPKSYFEIEVSRKVGCVLTCNEVYFVSLADNFGVQFSKLLKLPSGMGPLITGSFEKQAPDHLSMYALETCVYELCMVQRNAAALIPARIIFCVGEGEGELIDTPIGCS